MVQELDISYIDLQQKNAIYYFRRLAQLPNSDPHRYDSATALFSLNEDSGVLASYEVLEDAGTPNQIMIDAVDSIKHTVTGRFQITFFKRDGLVPTPYGFADTLRFTNGSFVLRLP